MCTHGTLLVCSCVHMVRCWCVDVYRCVMCHAIAVSCLIVHRFLILIGFNVFLLAMCLLSVWLFLFTSGVCDIYIIYICILHVCLYVYANRVKWKRCKLQVIVDFSARFGEKNSSLDIVKTFNDQLHLKTWYEVYLWTTTFYMKKHSNINTMTTRTTNGCGYSSHVVTVDLVPSRANPPGGANMLEPVVTPLTIFYDKHFGKLKTGLMAIMSPKLHHRRDFPVTEQGKLGET